MTKYAEVDGIGTLEFPDDTPDDVIDKAVMDAVQEAGALSQASDAAAPAPPAVPLPPPPSPAPTARGPVVAPSGTGLNPERAALYSSEQGRPLEAIKREVREAIEGVKQFGSAAVRPFYKAAEQTLLPLDIAHSVERFIREGDYSPEAARKSFVYGPVDPRSPTQQAEAWLDEHTSTPHDTTGRLAELGSTILVGGKIPGPIAPPASSGVTSGAPTLAQQAIAAGEKHSVPVYFDDVTGSAFARKLGVGAENVPLVGTSAGRAEQAKAAAQAASRIGAKFGVDDLADEVPPLVQKGLQDKLGVLRTEARARYDAASELLNKAADVVPTPRFVMAIRRELQHQKSLGTAANPEVVKLLTKYQLVPEGNFSLARNVRSQLKGEISSFYTGGENRAIGEAGVERLQGIRTALEADMSEFAKKTGGAAYDAWKSADDFWKTNLVPFKERGFADLVKTAEPEKAWKYLMAEGGLDSRANRMYNSLTDAGRETVRAGVVQDAIKSATGPTGIFSPAKYAKYMEDHATVVDHFFKGADRQEIDGFTNLMRHVTRAGQYMENPPTGQRVIGALMVGSAALSMKPLLIGAAAAGGTRVLFQTTRGRDLLLAASKLKPGSPAMNVLGNRIGRLMLSGSMAGYREQPEQESGDVGTE
jgi:hypothetical protein